MNPRFGAFLQERGRLARKLQVLRHAGEPPALLLQRSQNKIFFRVIRVFRG
jgi:hypothetical protein